MAEPDVVALAEDEWSEAARRLTERWLSGRWVQAAHPFRDGVRPVVFEEFAFWRKAFHERLGRVLAATGEARFYALEYVGNEDGSIRFISGHSVRGDLPHSEYERLGNDIGFALNGMEFHLCDASFAWTVGSTVDVQFEAGDDAFWQAWLPTLDERRAAVENLRQLLSGDQVRPEFERMLTYFREA